MKISNIQPTQTFLFGAQGSCCQCALPGSDVEPLVTVRATVDGETVRFHVHLDCLMQLAGIAAQAYWRTITEPRAKARQRTA